MVFASCSASEITSPPTVVVGDDTAAARDAASPVANDAQGSLDAGQDSSSDAGRDTGLGPDFPFLVTGKGFTTSFLMGYELTRSPDMRYAYLLNGGPSIAIFDEETLSLTTASPNRLSDYRPDQNGFTGFGSNFAERFTFAGVSIYGGFLAFPNRPGVGPEVDDVEIRATEAVRTTEKLVSTTPRRLAIETNSTLGTKTASVSFEVPSVSESTATVSADGTQTALLNYAYGGAQSETALVVARRQNDAPVTRYNTSIPRGRFWHNHATRAGNYVLDELGRLWHLTFAGAAQLVTLKPVTGFSSPPEVKEAITVGDTVLFAQRPDSDRGPGTVRVLRWTPGDASPTEVGSMPVDNRQYRVSALGTDRIAVSADTTSRTVATFDVTGRRSSCSLPAYSGSVEGAVVVAQSPRENFTLCALDGTEGRLSFTVPKLADPLVHELRGVEGSALSNTWLLLEDKTLPSKPQLSLMRAGTSRELRAAAGASGQLASFMALKRGVIVNYGVTNDWSWGYLRN